MKVRLYKADEPNSNGIIYSESVLKNAVSQFNKSLFDKSHTCKLIQFTSSNEYGNVITQLDKVAANITKLSYDEGYVVCEFEILDTPYGKIAKNFLSELYVMPVGVGHVDEKVITSFSIANIQMMGSPQLSDTVDNTLYKLR